jgi:hypothetical protein
MRCSPALLLSLCLVAALARAQDDSQFCSAVNEDDPSGEWQWISNISDTQDSFMDVPEDVLNATIQVTTGGGGVGGDGMDADKCV